ncbi:hypothetical protein SGL43_06610 [Streptomyces globisporus]|uniref:DUF397 domain-containing protein n=1 Tax=Streptomyces globisporus TaxID=1908 RepID=A0ABM9H7D2_STRGL|nr:hypothetical protein SGL43_06610 [Streptomyces globisporus]
MDVADFPSDCHARDVFTADGVCERTLSASEALPAFTDGGGLVVGDGYRPHSSSEGGEDNQHWDGVVGKLWPEIQKGKDGCRYGH